MNIAVYCSAKDSIPEEYLKLGDELGQRIAQEGHSLVYGGATGGLMSRTSESFLLHRDAATQKLTGVIPGVIVRAKRSATHCDELVSVANMSERKQKMRELSDCFICLPGSYGTLDEMFDVISSGVVGEHHKPIYILNHNGFYTPLQQLAEHMKELHFLPVQESFAPVFVNNLSELFTLIKPQNK